MTTCPSCGIAGNNFSCPNHTYWGINPLPDSIPMPEQSAWSSLYVEIGRLNVLLNERDKEIERLRGERPAVVAWLQAEAQRMLKAGDRPAWFVLKNRAEAVERGEHRREGGVMSDEQTARRLCRLTGASLLECFRAIAECGADEARAVEWLRRNMRCGEHIRKENE